jgi:ribonuclease HII
MGIDEAGRGCVIGPLCVGACTVFEKDLHRLKEAGAKDSKELSDSERKEIAGLILPFSESRVIEITPEEIDNENLNTLELRAIAKLIDGSDCKEVFIDSISKNEKRVEEMISRMIKRKDVKITAKIKGDQIFPVVSAASIFAKNRREDVIANLREKWGDFGSGYSSDPKTNSYLRDFYKEKNFFPVIARKKWFTIERIQAEVEQRSVLDF